MRLRNVRGAKEKIESNDKVILNPKEYRGSFNTLFNTGNGKLCIEIGMGKGKFIRDMAIKYPDVNFIGLEKFDSVMVRALEKTEGLDIPNLKYIREDATCINEIFDHEIDTIYLNFSDPWPKNRHAIRRLTSINFLKKYDDIFKGTKHIIFKTDNRHLFEFSVKELTDYDYKIDELILDLYNEDTSDNVSTEYEDKFSSKGDIIYKIEVHK